MVVEEKKKNFKSSRMPEGKRRKRWDTKRGGRGGGEPGESDVGEKSIELNLKS